MVSDLRSFSREARRFFLQLVYFASGAASRVFQNGKNYGSALRSLSLPLRTERGGVSVRNNMARKDHEDMKEFRNRLPKTAVMETSDLEDISPGVFCTSTFFSAKIFFDSHFKSGWS